MQREALAPAVAHCEVVPAALDERIGDVAALCVALGFLSHAALAGCRGMARRTLLALVPAR